MTATELRSRRLALGLTQQALAQRLGLSPNTIARWERGEVPITAPAMLRLALELLAR